MSHLPLPFPRESINLPTDPSFLFCRSTLGELSKLAMCPPEAIELRRLASEAGFEEVRSKEMTLLEVIEGASSLPLSLSLFTSYFTIAKVSHFSSILLCVEFVYTM